MRYKASSISSCLFHAYTVWFQAPSAVAAPANDLRFCRELSSYDNITIQKAATEAFGRHLWYISEVLVGLAYFDPSVSEEEKSMMVHNMSQQEGSVNPRPNVSMPANH